MTPVAASGKSVLLTYRDFTAMSFGSAVTFHGVSTGYGHVDLPGGRHPFLTPAQAGCGPSDHADLNVARTSDDLAGTTRLQGASLLRHRRGRCGRFTLHFRWADPSNPAPTILPGWRWPAYPYTPAPRRAPIRDILLLWNAQAH